MTLKSNTVSVAFVLVAMSLLAGCGSKPSPVGSSSSKTGSDTLYVNGNSLLSQIQALPSAQRTAFMNAHSRQISVAMRQDPQFKEKFQQIMGSAGN